LELTVSGSAPSNSVHWGNTGSGYQGTITYEYHPTVSAGSVITKAQMDTLRSYLGKGTAVTQNGTITATVGNTYKSGLTAGSTAIDDNWYNTASI